MENYKENPIYKDAEEHFNELCICGNFSISRLVGFAYDSNDFYYIFRDNVGEDSYISAAANFESLKGKIDTYDYIDSVFTLSGCPNAEHFDTIVLEDEEDELDYDEDGGESSWAQPDFDE